MTNHERVGKGLDLLRAGLGPFVEREVKRAIQAHDLDADLLRQYASDPTLRRRSSEWDVALLLRMMWETWNDVFRIILGRSDRSLVSELRDHRNRWAHQAPFSTDDAYRALDSAQRLLTSISAPQARDLDDLKQELLRLRFQEPVRGSGAAPPVARPPAPRPPASSRGGRPAPAGASNSSDAHSRGSLMRDLTKYDLRVGDDSFLALPKRRLIFHIVKAVLENGGSPERVAGAITPARKFMVINGRFRAEQVIEEHLRKRWFCKSGELFYVDGKTCILSNQWGRTTLDSARNLSVIIPELNCRWTPA